MIFNYESVDEAIDKSGYKKKQFSRFLNMTPKTLRLKRKGVSDFTATEIAVICTILNLDPSIFFEDRISLKEQKRD